MQGDILKNGLKVSEVYGTYLGFIEIDNKRYIKSNLNQKIIIFTKDIGNTVLIGHLK